MEFFYFSVALTGCISKQPAYSHNTHTEKQENGTYITNQIVTCVGCKTDFTDLGILWNTVSYGALGMPYGLVQGAYNGYQDSEQTNSILKIGNSAYSAIKGIGYGCYQGLCYGYNLEYDKGRSVEGHVFDLIEHTADYLYKNICQGR